MAKAQKCFVRLHGACKEIPVGEFESKAKARQWVKQCWNRPYTIVPVK